jgi:peptidoglycan/LPS O-acetylase OafA/YrhL
VAYYLGFTKRVGGNEWLDLVRSLAITLVLLRHGYRAVAENAEAAISLWSALLLNGWVGVDLFFVLSGYLITGHLLRSGIGLAVLMSRNILQ